MRGFHDLILDACLHCYAYDAQIEGTRADYMLELIDGTPDKELYYDSVLKTLAGGEDSWDAAQRFRFAACLGMDGDARAKRAMYEAFSPGPKMGEAIGIHFLQMDGVEGLLFAAEKLGSLLMTTTESVDLGWMMSVARENLGDEQARETLRKAGEGNPRIEVYRLALDASRKRLDERLGKSRDIANMSYDQLLPRLSELTFVWIRSWGEKASETDIERAADGLATAQNPKEQRAHLHIFSRRRFPGDIQLLLSMVNEEERVGLGALIALSQITHPSVRELAFRLINARAKWRGEAVELLLRNFRPGDHEIALRWFEAEDDEEARHSVGSDLLELCEMHPDKAEPSLMRALYEKGPCSFCRKQAVEKLIELNALGEDLRTECAYDSNDDIRELVKEPDPQAQAN
jgi:hypothetical protein